MDAILTGSRTQIQNAINKAHAMGGGRRVRWLGGFSFEVKGEHGVYNVDWQGSNTRCNCKAGVNGRVCWHLAACWTWKLAKSSAKRAVAS